MTFDTSNIILAPKRSLPVFLLLDVSESMDGEKIQSLNKAVRDMLETFRDTEDDYFKIDVIAITFGHGVKVHQALTNDGEIKWDDLSADGGGRAPLGAALKLAKTMIGYNVPHLWGVMPIVVLVSNGHPTGDWKRSMDEFIGEGASARCDRLAMAIGADADEAMLGHFIEAGRYKTLLYAEDAKRLRELFNLFPRPERSCVRRERVQSQNLPDTEPPGNWNDIETCEEKQNEEAYF